MAGLTLLTVTLYLYFRKKNYLYTAIPMVFMLVTTLAAMIINVVQFFNQGSYLLLAVGAVVLFLALWLVFEGILRFTRGREEAIAGVREVLG